MVNIGLICYLIVLEVQSLGLLVLRIRHTIIM